VSLVQSPNFTLRDTTLSQDELMRYKRLLQWVKASGGIIGDVEIRSWPRSYERGVFARADIQPGVFAVIPRNISLNTHNAIEHAGTELRALLVEIRDNFGATGEVNDRAALAMFIVHEKLVSGEWSPWFPYIDTLPQSDVRYSSLLFANPGDLERWGVKGLVGLSVESAWKAIARMFKMAKEYPALFPVSEDVLVTELRWSYYMVMSRAWTREALEMIPFADIMNHRVNSPVTLIPNATHNNFVIFDHHGAILRGAEVFDTYQKAPSPTLYGLSWGFVPEASECFLPLERPVSGVSWARRRLLARLGCLSDRDHSYMAFNCAAEELDMQTTDCLRAFTMSEDKLLNATEWSSILRGRQGGGPLVEGTPDLDFAAVTEVVNIFEKVEVDWTDENEARMADPATDVVEKLALRIKYGVFKCVDQVRWIAARKYAEAEANKKSKRRS